MESIKVSIVEDNPKYQKWIYDTLQNSTNLKCVSQHYKSEEALAKIPYYKPDVVIMDLDLKGSRFNGIECILRLRINWPDLKFLVLSSHGDEQHIVEALRVGAGAYIHRDEVTQESLIESINSFYKGEAPMSRGIAKSIITILQRPQESLVELQDDMQRLRKLTPRENSVLELLSKGKLYKEVAYELGIKEGTVKQHAHSIYQKLQANNLAEALLKYFRIRFPNL